MPIERFLAQRDSEDDSDAFAASALNLPLPPPSAANFPALPRPTPAPKMTKAEKAMAEKISTLLLSDAKGKTPVPAPAVASPVPVSPPVKTTALIIPGKATAAVKLAPRATRTKPEQPKPTGIIPIPVDIREEVFPPSPGRSGAATLIMAMAVVHAEHAISCTHLPDTCGVTFLVKGSNDTP
ncbi:hypothetical protein AX14_011939 [Amanita brunnescens Koide BX004]|nr:hypothetical protein AX14_011939 [Amanita brunnescens Koide BX004]